LWSTGPTIPLENITLGNVKWFWKGGAKIPSNLILPNAVFRIPPFRGINPQKMGPDIMFSTKVRGQWEYLQSKENAQKNSWF